MKHSKIIIAIFLLSIFSPTLYANSVTDAIVATTTQTTAGNTMASPGNVLSSSNTTNGGTNVPSKVYVSEMVPGATCWCNIDGERAGSANESCPDDIKVENRRYECEVQKGMTAFQNIIRDITKWLVYIIMLFGVLALVGAGILWAWGSESETYTKKAKGWAMNIIIGLAILFTFRYILGFLAPWIFQ